MNRPQQVREIYAELRRSLGDHVSSREILNYAFQLVELSDDADDGPQFDLRSGGVSFAQCALDVAFADGGWRVLAMERHEDCDPDGDVMDGINRRQLFQSIETGVIA